MISTNLKCFIEPPPPLRNHMLGILSNSPNVRNNVDKEYFFNMRRIFL